MQEVDLVRFFCAGHCLIFGSAGTEQCKIYCPVSGGMHHISHCLCKCRICPKLNMFWRYAEKYRCQNGSGTLETKKGIAAANPSHVQEELLSSFLCIYYTVYAAAPQIFAEQKKQPVIWLLLYTTN